MSSQPLVPVDLEAQVSLHEAPFNHLEVGPSASAVATGTRVYKGNNSNGQYAPSDISGVRYLTGIIMPVVNACICLFVRDSFGNLRYRRKTFKNNVFFMH